MTSSPGMVNIHMGHGMIYRYPGDVKISMDDIKINMNLISFTDDEMLTSIDNMFIVSIPNLRFCSQEQ